jgi:hypothetical protein
MSVRIHGERIPETALRKPPTSHGPEADPRCSRSHGDLAGQPLKPDEIAYCDFSR